jgi:sn-glycerol 3-phosphate transport system permease protein
VTFTHYPTVATLWQSVYSAGTATRPARFVGLDNYAALLGDEVFWKVLANNLWFA